MKLIKDNAAFLIVLLICSLLRLFPLFDYQFTLDELSGLSRTRFDTLGELIENGVKIDAHPALIQVFIYFLAKIFGYKTWIIKLPFILMSLGALIYSYVLCARNFSKQSGVFSSLILGFSLIYVFYAPIARMYSAGVFFSMALLFYFFEIFFRHNGRRINYVLLGLFALLCALNHHISALFAFTLCASGLLFLDKANRFPYFLTCLLAVLLYLPHMPVTLYQLAIGGIGFGQNGWLPVPESDTLGNFIKIVLGTGKTYLVFVALAIAAVFLNRSFKFNSKQVFLFCIFLVNYLVIYFYSVYRAVVYQHSVMLFSSTAFVIFVASFLEFNNRVNFYRAAVITMLVLTFKTYFKKNYLGQSVKTIFEYQFERTFHYQKLYGGENVYPVFFDADEFMKDIYFEKYKGNFAGRISSDSVIFSTRSFSELVSTCQADYFVLASSMPLQQAVVRQYYPFLIENTQTQGINFKVYSRKQSEEKNSVEDDRVVASSNVFNTGGFDYRKTDKLLRKNNTIDLRVDSLEEFPFEAKTKYYQVVSAEGQVMLMKMRFKPERFSSGGISACISVNDKNTNANYSYSEKQVSDFVMNDDSTVTVYVDTYFGTSHRNIAGKANITAYVWNKNKENFRLKEMEIEVIDFCPKKWQLWD